MTPIQKLRFTGNGRDNAETAPVYNHFYMKREDLLPYSFGGNKVRFAQKFIEDMKREHCDSMSFTEIIIPISAGFLPPLFPAALALLYGP